MTTTDRLFIETKQLIVSFLANGCVMQTRYAQSRNDVVQHVLCRQTACTAQLGRRRDTVFKNAASQCSQLQTS